MARIIPQQGAFPGKRWTLHLLVGAILCVSSPLMAAESAPLVSGWGDTQRGVQRAGTVSRQDIETRRSRERKYRSCLFSYLPRMGSDVAAELIRDACRAEYLEQQRLP